MFFTIYTAPLLKNISAWDHFGNFGQFALPNFHKAIDKDTGSKVFKHKRFKRLSKRILLLPMYSYEKYVFFLKAYTFKNA